MSRLLTVLVLLVFLPTAGLAADFYVDGSVGSDGNSCSNAALPCKTIKAALDKVPVGNHTIRVTKGTYMEDGMLIPGHKFITIKGGYDETFSPRVCTQKTVIQTVAAAPGGSYSHLSGVKFQPIEPAAIENQRV